METEKLYYADPYLRRFSAKVLSCTKEKQSYHVTLDRSVFYPEGGGQPGDTGMLGGVRVTDTHARDGEIIHFCAEALEPGQIVDGEIDWARRFDLMQQHSGEHIVSGIICGVFHCDNVGFHLGAETVVIDFNAPVPPEKLPEIEAEANRAIWENRPFLISFPDPEALKQIPYRSKKALEGQVRIVECPGADCCACCGTHVSHAGEIGLIKLISIKPFREGVRIELLAGQRAYAFVNEAVAQNGRISGLLSAKPGETAAAVERVQQELSAANYRLYGYENRHFAAMAEVYAGAGNVLVFEDGLTPDALRRACDSIAAACGGRCALFSGSDTAGYKYAVGHNGGDLRAFGKAMNSALNGRGGGKPDFLQGSVAASRAEIEEFFLENP